ncbi:hypothetical protein [Gemmata sp.]|uniref:hypothetical protein n=1 Tax=Gemmata sp. TaxID=1914242 RepID=UPI003F705AA8
MTEPDAPAVEWWLWPNVLALDAPVVAVVWQRFLAGTVGATVPASASVALGLVVWGIYLLDRRLDAARPGFTQPRHTFARRNPYLVTVLAFAALVAAALLAVTLPWAYLEVGAVVAGLVAGYFGLVHLTRAALPIAKESLVGVLFAAGVSVPLIASDAPLVAWLPSTFAFGLLCWLNCALIERWESGASGGAILPVLLALGVLLTGATSPAAVRGALGTSVALLLVLHAARHPTGTKHARVLADVALLTPLAVYGYR